MPGDTCASLAASFHTTVDAIQRANSKPYLTNLVHGALIRLIAFVNCNDIWTNTLLAICEAVQVGPAWSGPIPTPTVTTSCQSYTTKEEETCASIAAKFGTTAFQIYANNSLSFI